MPTLDTVLQVAGAVALVVGPIGSLFSLLGSLFHAPRLKAIGDALAHAGVNAPGAIKSAGAFLKGAPKTGSLVVLVCAGAIAQACTAQQAAAVKSAAQQSGECAARAFASCIETEGVSHAQECLTAPEYQAKILACVKLPAVDADAGAAGAAGAP